MAREQPASREEVARREIGQTSISRPLQLALATLFVVTVAFVPAWELARTTRELGGLAGWGRSIGGFVEKVRYSGRNDGLTGANRELLAEMQRLENGIEERSLVAAVVLPSIQWIQSAWLEVGNEQVILGRESWLFYRPSVELLSGKGYLRQRATRPLARGGALTHLARRTDPRPAILATRRQLAEQGITLVVMPVPVKTAIHPEKLGRGSSGVATPMHDPSWSQLVRELEREGVLVFDPAPLLVAARASTEAPQYLRGDTHWRPEAVERVAAGLADFLESQVALSGRDATSAVRRERHATSRGDLVAMLKLPDEQTLFGEQTVTIRSVTGPDGGPWRPVPGAEILLLGDSFTNVYSTPDLGWGAGAGLAEQLSYSLGRPIDRIAVNAGGAHTARARLADQLARDPDRLATTRVVVWEFSARELATGDWRTIPLTAASEPAGDRPLPLGEGFVVWESNRTGEWRIWSKRLDGTGLRQISPDESGMQHCCAHISPDGSRVAYLSRAGGRDRYPEVEVSGELRLIATEDWSETAIVAARTYGWGNRAAVWRNDEEIIAIDPDGRTVLVDLEAGSRRQLTTEPRETMGWLVDASLRWATNAAPSFSPYDPSQRRVVERKDLGGCEPYFSHDGRWGFWVAGAGGPVNRIDLATRAVTALVGKNDPRMPADRGYVYFAMASRDGRLLALGASPGEHSHFEADYDIFVAPTDPRTLNLIGAPVRMTDHRATDRYPDSFLRPLALGRHDGEAPVTVRLVAPSPADWQWDLGDGSSARGAEIEHTFRDPGTYLVRAESLPAGVTLRGLVTVGPAVAPRISKVESRKGGREVVLRFDEAVSVEGAKVEVEAGGEVASIELADDGRSLVVTLRSALSSGARLHLEGIVDRAAVPNRMDPQWVEIAPTAWPVSQDGLVFLWQTEDRPNLFVDPRIGEQRSVSLTPRRRARLDHDHALVLEGGPWLVPEQDARLVAQRVRASNELSMELTLTPHRSTFADSAPIVTLARGGNPYFALVQRGRELMLRLGTSGDRAATPRRIVDLEPNVAHHLLLTYAPARFAAYLDGKPLPIEDPPVGGLGSWRPPVRLLFGEDAKLGAGWEGAVEGIAFWDRVLTPAEAGEAYRRSLAIRTQRPEVESWEVEAILRRTSPLPTLEEISPYRQALVAYEYETRGGEDPGSSARVVHWAILDAETQPAGRFRRGQVIRLTLERFADNAQLHSQVVSNTLPAGSGDLWFAVEATPVP